MAQLKKHHRFGRRVEKNGGKFAVEKSFLGHNFSIVWGEDLYISIHILGQSFDSPQPKWMAWGWIAGRCDWKLEMLILGRIFAFCQGPLCLQGLQV